MKFRLSKEQKATGRLMAGKEAGGARTMLLKLFLDLTKFFPLMLENGRWLSTPSDVSAWET
jgi:hypothetical protein